MSVQIRCPKCQTTLDVRITRADDPPCYTCGRLISEHITKFGHASWCEFPYEARTPDRTSVKPDGDASL